MYAERGGMRLNIVVDPADPSAWKRAPYYDYIKRMSHRAAEGHELVVYVDDRRIVVFPHEDIDLGPVTPQQEIVFGHAERDGERIAVARIVDLPGPTAAATPRP